MGRSLTCCLTCLDYSLHSFPFNLIKSADSNNITGHTKGKGETRCNNSTYIYKYGYVFMKDFRMGRQKDWKE